MSGSPMRQPNTKALKKRRSQNAARKERGEPLRLYWDDTLLKSKLKPHQAHGVEFLWRHIAATNPRKAGCILADFMGLGKTVQVICSLDLYLMSHLKCRDPLPKVMILAPSVVLLNWEREIQKFIFDNAPQGDRLHMRPFTLANASRREEREHTLLKWFKEGGILLIGYELFRSMLEADSEGMQSSEPSNEGKSKFEELLLDPGPDVIILDEGHRIRSRATQISKLVYRIKTPRRIILTGYPLQTKLSEYFTMADWVCPDVLGDFDTFRQNFELPIAEGQTSDAPKERVEAARRRVYVLQDKLKDIVLRRPSKVLDDTLPPHKEFVLWCALSPLQNRILNHFGKWRKRRSRTSCQMEGEFMEVASSGQSSDVLSSYNDLTMLINHPDILRMQILTDCLDLRNQMNGVEKKMSRQQQYEAALSLGDHCEELHDPQVQARYGYALPFLFPGLEGKAGAAPYTPNLVSNSGKCFMLLSMLEQFRRVNDRTVVFSRSLRTLDYLHRIFTSAQPPPDYKVPPASPCAACGSFLISHSCTACADRKPGQWRPFVSLRLDGSTSAECRDRLIQSFNTLSSQPISPKEPSIFFISTKAGGEGINLTGGNRVVIYDVSFNPCADGQAARRCKRYGQCKPVYIYRMVGNDSVESTVLKRQVAREALSAQIVDDQYTQHVFSAADLRSLFRQSSADEDDLPEEAEVPVGEVDKPVVAELPTLERVPRLPDTAAAAAPAEQAPEPCKEMQSIAADVEEDTSETDSCPAHSADTQDTQADLSLSDWTVEEEDAEGAVVHGDRALDATLRFLPATHRTAHRCEEYNVLLTFDADEGDLPEELRQEAKREYEREVNGEAKQLNPTLISPPSSTTSPGTSSSSSLLSGSSCIPVPNKDEKALSQGEPSNSVSALQKTAEAGSDKAQAGKKKRRFVPVRRPSSSVKKKPKTDAMAGKSFLEPISLNAQTALQ